MAMSPMERIRAARATFEAAAKGETKAAPAAAAQTEHQEAEAKPVAVNDAGIAANPLYKIMNDTAKSNDQKIAAIVKYLTAENGDYATARRRFAEFETYFNHAQNESMQLDVKGIERLIEEIKSALKPEIEKIVGNVIQVQKGVDDSKKFLVELRTARLQGKTIDEISAAMEINDQLIKSMGELKETLADLDLQEKDRKDRLDAWLDRKTASEKGVGNWIARKLSGPDKDIAKAIDLAQERLDDVKARIERSKKTCEEMATRRNAQLESGPLTILRTIDATEKGFSENLIATAQNSLKLIEGATESIQRLLKRTAYSEAMARDIGLSIAAAEVRETILKAAVQQVSLATEGQGKQIKGELEKKDAEIAATPETEVKHALLKAERVDIAQRHDGALDYQEALNQTRTNFEVISAGSVEAKGRANQLASLIATEKELLKRLGTEALPATTLALRMVLETDVAQQNSELALTIGAITEKARTAGKDSLEILAKTQGELHNQQLQDMDRAIQALAAAEETIATRIETTVHEGIETRQRMKGIVDASAGLQQVLNELNEIRPTVAARELDQGEPNRPGTKAGVAEAVIEKLG